MSANLTGRTYVSLSLLAFGFAGCATEQAFPPSACRETIAQYCARKKCLLDGVGSLESHPAWCRAVGPFDASSAQASTCAEYDVIFEGTRDGWTTKYWYDARTGKLVYVEERRQGTGESGCAGGLGRPDDCRQRVVSSIDCASR